MNRIKIYLMGSIMKHIALPIIVAFVISEFCACGDVPRGDFNTDVSTSSPAWTTAGTTSAEPEITDAETETANETTNGNAETSADIPEITSVEVESTALVPDTADTDSESGWLMNEPPLSEAIMTILAVPDFLDENQQLLYRRARSVFIAFNGYPEMIEEYPCENVLEIPYEDKSVYIPSGDHEAHYIRACGRYQKWEDFHGMGVSIFTEEYFTRLSRHFLNIDGNTYYPDAAKGGAFGYMPELTPDTFELVSKTDSEIEFNVIGHYYSTWNPETANPSTITTQSFPIRMELTDSGWRFSLFNYPG